jgi:hypothetical protein
MQFVKIFQNGNRDDALHYASTHLSPFATGHIVDSQNLKASRLVFFGLKSLTSPYTVHYFTHLTGNIGWLRNLKDISGIFLGQSYNSPLSVTVAAGIQFMLSIIFLFVLSKGISNRG